MAKMKNLLMDLILMDMDFETMMEELPSEEEILEMEKEFKGY